MNDEYFLIDAVADKPNKTKLQAKSQCLKIAQNVAFEFFNFCHIKSDLSVSTV